ncbi:MAG: phosphonate ABC transporter substrate-binding protein [Lautropia sp.]
MKLPFLANPQRRLLAAAIATLPLLHAAPAAAQATPEINFGIISTESSRNLKAAWDPLLTEMAAATGTKINAFFAPDYAGIIEGMRFNKVQIAWYGNKSAMEAVDRANAEVFAQTVDTNGTRGYYSLLVVHKDSPVKSLEDVLKSRKVLTLGMGDPNSTSGTLVPGYYAFAQNGVDPMTDFKRTVRSNHESNLLAVANRQIDVATNNTDNWDRFKMTNPAKIGDLREVWRSPLIPSDPLVWRKDLDPALKAKFRDFLLGYGSTPAQKQTLATLGWSGLVASSDRQLVPIRQLELAKDKVKIEADTALGADEKQKKLRAINEQLNALQSQLAQK